MAKETLTVRLSPREDVGDDLTELLGALREYNRGPDTASYAALQALAEQTEGTLTVRRRDLDEFSAYMKEFGVDALAGAAAQPTRT